MSEPTPDTDIGPEPYVPDYGALTVHDTSPVGVIDSTWPDGPYDHDADYDRAVQYAGDGEVTTDARGNTVLADGVDPLAVLERAEHGIDWPDGAAPMPAGFTSLTPAERTDWLIEHDWPGVITADGYPVAANPWGDPTSVPIGIDPKTLVEPVAKGRGRRARMGGPEAAARANGDAEDAGKHGQVKGIGGGSGKNRRRGPLGAKVGRGDGGTGGGGLRSLFTFNVNVLAGAFSGWLSPDVGSGNSGSLIAAGKRH